MAKNAMPVSKAKTAYGLLSEIRKLILEEPKRYDQTDFLRTGDDAQRIHSSVVPACGTVGCVAGWIGFLKGDFVAYGRTRDGSCRWVDDFASETLFGNRFDERAGELFHADAAGKRDSLAAHAKRGATHIAKFQKKYAKQLKAKKV